jgi:hypothetical protein
MRLRPALWIVALAAAAQAGCRGPTDTQASTAKGRYLGVGVFSAGELWSKMAVPANPDPTAATSADDEHVIVVVDSQTGEIRECGDYSGVCASFNPWTRAIAREQTAPVKLTRHAADLVAKPQPDTRPPR